MSIVKSFSVDNGDMFYISHNSDNFTIIDCNLSDLNRYRIVDEIKQLSAAKQVLRFISTHPDEDHIKGLEYLDSEINIRNFYCCKNNARKTSPSPDFLKYCELRNSDKAFYIFTGCRRRWMNENDAERKESGISILWPDTTNQNYIRELTNAYNGISYNNISPIITYKLQYGVSIMWMGDLETDFMDSIKAELNLYEIDILFAPHHGRNSGKIPEDILDILNPKLLVIGQAPSIHLNYYNNYNTITQNSSGDITFLCENQKVLIFTSNTNYSVNFLQQENLGIRPDYLGTLFL